MQVIRGYRRLLRASRQAFRGDVYALKQARMTLREHFIANRQGRAKQGTGENGTRFEVQLTDPQRHVMRKDEELVPLTENSATQPLVMNSGNICQRPA
ncbi:LYR MOTIF-CONTAINING PROTEIN 7 [Plasmopara halstedii]|uniref:LYR MOTIF-CONTAINING PROTEIN 7 n=1 Tax=Plasmopara halstedii TaxID=4781 RepID=A0A0P1A7Z6_PLAHL|nr:LYR MOTIF-CONTAINING PROTEIN 7 [Plasmopara halstedii]CEG36620.1 LYR MOTIF-CONTAINING PROTEIN 7 [Plasmopara halstedii]|eukprot:XP_024572989.1 LYR MOTIF-CONTAINING PROTEIN 7 [Plasmopara halstedii]